MRITFLGTGTSHGIPMIGCACAVCRSEDVRDRRTRSAAAFHEGDACWIVDTPPELRLQCLACGIEHIDGVLLTHDHADHIFGMDDLRRFNELQDNRPIPVYRSEDTLATVRRAFSYAFEDRGPDGRRAGLKRPVLELRPAAAEFEAPPFRVGSFDLPHGPARTLGYAFSSDSGSAAYFTDCSSVPARVIEAVRGVDVLVIDALRTRQHPSHLTVADAAAVARATGARRTYLTHLCHEIGHEATENGLPPDIRVAYDGLTIEVCRT